MIIAGVYSFNGGKEIIESAYRAELGDIERAIASVDSKKHKTKISKEKTMRGRRLYNPKSLNAAFKKELASLGWKNFKVASEYSPNYYVGGYKSNAASKGAFREMDFVKNRVGLEIQFGKYAFMVYNVSAKMTIFHNLDIIDVGVEIVPLKDFADQMSTGVSYFEQFVWDLQNRGVSSIDIPVLILGIAA
jgi:hypothetical protein